MHQNFVLTSDFVDFDHFPHCLFSGEDISKVEMVLKKILLIFTKYESCYDK
jgi:hypothetical protein